MAILRSVWLLGLALLAAACASGTGEQAADPASPLADEDAYRVVARVNGTPILGRQIEEIVDAERARMTARDVEPTPEVLDDLRRAGPNALAAAKRLVYEVPEMSQDRAFAFTAELSARLFASDEAAEGMRAFLAREDPAWVGPRARP